MNYIEYVRFHNNKNEMKNRTNKKNELIFDKKKSQCHNIVLLMYYSLSSS